MKLEQLSDSQWNELDNVVARFECALWNGEQPDPREFAQSSDVEQSALLLELIHGQVDYHARTGKPVNVSEFIERFPELKTVQGVEEALAETIAQAQGTQLTHDQREPAATRLPSFTRYQVEQCIGRGGMGAVYRAYDKTLERFVALKVLARSTHELNDRFRREATAAAQIDHPNVCMILDYGVENDIAFLTMPLYSSATLASVTRAQALSRDEVIDIMLPIVDGMIAVHAAGIVHRDLKPGNILLSDDQRPIVADFGLASLWQDSDIRLTQSGTPIGTPAYMAPEQVLGDLERIDARTDVYCLGVILFELLTGRLPYAGNLITLQRSIVDDPPPNPSDLNPELDHPLSQLCWQMLAKSPDDRPETMTAIRRQLQTLRGTDELTPEPQSAAYRDGARRRLPRFVFFLGAAALVMLAGFITIRVGKTVIKIYSDDPNLRVKIDTPEDEPSPPLRPKIANSLGMPMALIPPGSFMIGSPSAEGGRDAHEGPRRQITISRAFYMGTCEVTVGEFRKFVDDTKYVTAAEQPGAETWTYLYEQDDPWMVSNDLNWRNPGFEQSERDPVTCVTWVEAQQFCQWLSTKEGKRYRLPTEAEWEYACRAGTTTAFHFGNTISPQQANYNTSIIYENSKAKSQKPLGRTTKVGQYPPNAFGLYDMHGNLMEYTCDFFVATYANFEKTDPRMTQGSQIAVRGGAWHFFPHHIRSAYRFGGTKGGVYADTAATFQGFRVVCEVSQ